MKDQPIILYKCTNQIGKCSKSEDTLLKKKKKSKEKCKVRIGKEKTREEKKWKKLPKLSAPVKEISYLQREIKSLRLNLRWQS